jgi:hypothetical protein
MAFCLHLSFSHIHNNPTNSLQIYCKCANWRTRFECRNVWMSSTTYTHLVTFKLGFRFRGHCTICSYFRNWDSGRHGKRTKTTTRRLERGNFDQHIDTHMHARTLSLNLSPSPTPPKTPSNEHVHLPKGNAIRSWK